MGPGGFCFSDWPPHTRPWPIRFTPPAWLNIFAYATELAHTNPPLAHSIYASGLVNIFAYAKELASHKPAPSLCGYPLRVDWIMCFAHLQWVPGVFVFSGLSVEYCSGSLSKWDKKRNVRCALLDGGESSAGNPFSRLPDRSSGNATSSRWAVDFGLQSLEPL